jgi:lauroyl/myristoyl acyltransferase
MNADNLVQRQLTSESPLKVSPSATSTRVGPSRASSFYRAELWRLGQFAAKHLPPHLCHSLTKSLGHAYWSVSPARREVVIKNLLPGTNGDRAQAEQLSKELFVNFAQKLVDLWQYESGENIETLFRGWAGWEHFETARKGGRGILIVTPHLGNWEFGAPLLARKGIKLFVLTLEEPDTRVTEMRKAARSRWGIETLVIGRDIFAFVEVIRRLEEGAAVAMLVDRPAKASVVPVKLFNRSFAASVAPAELARATGCSLLPVYLPRTPDGYMAQALPPIAYDRPALRDPVARRELTQTLMGALEAPIRENLNQWYHFIPIWPEA